MSVLDERIHAGGASKAFGELTLEDVKERADELRAASAAGGPTLRVIPVAHAWGELARAMEEAGATTVAGLGEEAAAARAARLGVVSPGGSFLRSA